ncbi:hypothetical protein CRUP_004609 [Coryphaenoides rupestris]|nr:hypothetical protein CRUP_004609 [Coryphaenoides rupestris]
MDSDSTSQKSPGVRVLFVEQDGRVLAVLEQEVLVVVVDGPERREVLRPHAGQEVLSPPSLQLHEAPETLAVRQRPDHLQPVGDIRRVLQVVGGQLQPSSSSSSSSPLRRVQEEVPDQRLQLGPPLAGQGFSGLEQGPRGAAHTPPRRVLQHVQARLRPLGGAVLGRQPLLQGAVVHVGGGVAGGAQQQDVVGVVVLHLRGEVTAVLVGNDVLPGVRKDTEKPRRYHVAFFLSQVSFRERHGRSPPTPGATGVFSSPGARPEPRPSLKATSTRPWQRATSWVYGAGPEKEAAGVRAQPQQVEEEADGDLGVTRRVAHLESHDQEGEEVATAQRLAFVQGHTQQPTPTFSTRGFRSTSMRLRGKEGEEAWPSVRRESSRTRTQRPEYDAICRRETADVLPFTDTLGEGRVTERPLKLEKKKKVVEEEEVEVDVERAKNQNRNPAMEEHPNQAWLEGTRRAPTRQISRPPRVAPRTVVRMVDRDPRGDILDWGVAGGKEGWEELDCDSHHPPPATPEVGGVCGVAPPIVGRKAERRKRTKPHE